MTDKPKQYKRNWTPEGLQRLREAAQRNRPWEHSTGPRTPEGKARSRGNALWMGEHIKDPAVEYSPGCAQVQLIGALMAYDKHRSDEGRDWVYCWAVRVLELDPDNELAASIKASIDDWLAGQDAEGKSVGS